MIWYKFKTPRNNFSESEWRQLSSDEVSKDDFRFFMIRLNDKIYRADTPEFQEHLAKIKMWELLNR